MLRIAKVQMAAVLAAGILLGCPAAAGTLHPFPKVNAAPSPAEAVNQAGSSLNPAGINYGPLR